MSSKKQFTEEEVTSDLLLKYIYEELSAAEEEQLEDFLDEHEIYADAVEGLISLGVEHKVKDRLTMIKLLEQQSEWGLAKRKPTEQGTNDITLTLTTPTSKPTSSNDYSLWLWRVAAAAAIAVLFVLFQQNNREVDRQIANLQLITDNQQIMLDSIEKQNQMLASLVSSMIDSIQNWKEVPTKILDEQRKITDLIGLEDQPIAHVTENPYEKGLRPYLQNDHFSIRSKIGTFGTSEQDTIFRKWDEAYFNSRFEQVIEILQDYQKELQREENTVSVFGLGLAHFYLGNFEEAGNAFQTILESDALEIIFQWQEQARWFYALTLLGKADPDGLVVLEEIVNWEGSHYNKGEAKVLLVSLRK